MILLLIVGCTNTDVASEEFEKKIGKLESKILDLEETTEKQQATIEKHKEQTNITESKIEALEVKNAILKDSTMTIESNYFAINELIKHTMNSRTAILNYAEINGEKLSLTITYSEKITDGDAPNGFRLEETGEGTITIGISKDVPIYLLGNASTLIQATWEDVVSRRGMLQLFENNGEVVFISEIYIP